jgi:hypothetical protein
VVSVSHTAHNIEITAESLQEDLARLEIQKQALERELAAVVAHLGSVQRTLAALEPLMLGTAQLSTAGKAAGAGAEREDSPSQAPAESSTTTNIQDQQSTASRRGPRRPASANGSKAAGRASGAQADDDKKYGKLTEQILEYFAGAGDADVRARDVAAALGRDQDSASINAVRSTLDRLVGTSRIRRMGRGLYRAKRS